VSGHIVGERNEQIWLNRHVEGCLSVFVGLTGA
jgi:hypothetical protein